MMSYGQQFKNSTNQVPFIDVLKKANIQIKSLNNPSTDAIILGNGDLHSLCYADKDHIVLRLSKNDVYDARIDTSEDLDLTKIDIKTGKVSRELTLPPSWEKPYPLSINYANVYIDFSGNQKSTIDLFRSYATIDNEKIVIRSLLQDNVYHIQTSNNLELKGQPWPPIPEAQIGETDGVRWVKQVLPADASGDWKGMTVITALASKGSDHFIAVATSLEAENPMLNAITLAKEYASKDKAEIINTHENLWESFWRKSGINLSDDYLNQVWYQNLYFSRCAQNPKSQAIGLFIGPLLKPLDGWHDNYTVNYNFQQSFWSFLNSNHVEYVNPYNEVVLNYLPRAKWFAEQTYNIKGAFYPHNLFRHEPLNPENCSSNNNRMFAGAPWAYTLGLSGFLIHNVWLSYKFNPSEKQLKTIYPAIKEVAQFYANFCKQCHTNETGKLRLGPTISPEHMPFGVYDCPFDIAFIKFSFRIFLEASAILHLDKELVQEIKGLLPTLPEYPIDNTSGFIVDREKGKPFEYNIPVPTTPIFPAEQITFFSPTKEKEVFIKTLNSIKTNGNNSTVMLAVAKARLSTEDAKSWLKHEIRVRQKNNGSFNLSENNAAFNNYGHYTEMFALNGAISELLLQSVDNIIRVFPAWPKEEDALFTSLRARGGFLVSSELKNGKVSRLEVVSEFGEELNLYVPWEEIYHDGKELKKDNEGIINIKTEPNKVYDFYSK